jgi:thiamine biosynthesis lipoprotein
MVDIRRMKKQNPKLKAQLLLGFLVFWTGCGAPRDIINLTGHTMGTTFSIKIIPAESFNNYQKLELGIDSVLEAVNQKMSIWDPNSEISKFNRNRSTDPIPVSAQLFEVVESAMSLSEKTDGAFDITVFELMGLWGFGPAPKNGMPTDEEINKVLERTGWGQIKLLDNSIIKLNPKIKIDLNAIAKGYGVDQVFEYLRSLVYTDVFVEIGGEVRCSGKNQYNKSWSLGIEDPEHGASLDRDLAGVVVLDDRAMATSGNYQNFVDFGGEVLGHTINPKSGKPIITDVLSVTVLAESCMMSDSWATTLMTMDFKTGEKLVRSEKDLDVIWIIERSDASRRICSTKNIKVEDSIYEIINYQNLPQ